MEKIYTWHTDLPRNYRGNISYSFMLPHKFKKIHIQLQSNKERITDIDCYINHHQKELISILSSYVEDEVDENLLKLFVKQMKTEIQLCFLLNNEFIGNIHKPGMTKDIYLSQNESSDGCLPPPVLQGSAKIIVNIFEVVEEDTYINLLIEGE